jgi:hypothetical protein
MSHVPADARHSVPDDAYPSAGHAALDPLHVSATSHAPADPRHTKPDPRSASAGQLGLEPLHVSATSHAPAAARQVVPDAKPSAGQLGLEPVHVSATSQIPADARHTYPAPPVMFPHVPFDSPVSAFEHAWQSVVEPPPHALAQQNPSTQNPLAQSPGTVHALPTGSPLMHAASIPSHTSLPSLSSPWVEPA